MMEVVLALASRDGRVCPKPAAWARMFELLPGRRHDGYGSIPAEPLHGDAWRAAGDEDRRLRLVEHLEWARSHGALGAVQAFLMELGEAQWHHVGDEST